ncbi:MAG: murein L,D-transpeptidase [Myxococcales bacterium]
MFAVHSAAPRKAAFRAACAALLCLAASYAKDARAGPPPDSRAGVRDPIASGVRLARFRNDLLALYAPRAGRPLWIRDRTATPQARAVAEALRSASDEGLRPADYQGSGWLERFENIGPLDEARTLLVDIDFSAAVMRYASDLAIGRVDPRTLGIDAAPRERLPLARIAADLATSDDVQGALRSLEPQLPVYRRVLLALETYRFLESGAPAATLPDLRGTLQPGDAWPGVGPLSRLLRLLGDLPEEVEGSTRYEGPLVDAVVRFQRRHGLEPDGRIGKSTLVALRTPLRRRVEQLELTLERIRWVPRALPGIPLVVNVAGFRLIADGAGDAPRLDMKVVVGRAFRHETPPLASEVRKVIFQPYWYVPRSILRNEILPELKRHPDSFANRGYEIVDGNGRVVARTAPTGALEAELRSGRLLLRQRPGPHNPLGPVKFVLPNRYQVYLHGTSATALFARTRRDLSHGCIRVEDPLSLASWVLRENPEWTRDRIAGAMQGTTTVTVDVKSRIPVLVVYATAAVGPVGEVLFFDDVYRDDEALRRALAPATEPAG